MDIVITPSEFTVIPAQVLFEAETLNPEVIVTLSPAPGTPLGDQVELEDQLPDAMEV